MNRPHLNLRPRSLACSLALALAAGTAFSCAADVEQDPAQVALNSAALVNGTVVTNEQNPGAVAVFHNYPRPCSGTLIRNTWVITALHCLITDGDDLTTPFIPLSQVRITSIANPGLNPPAFASTATKLYRHPTQDLALIKFAPALAKPVGLWNGDWSAVGGKTVGAFGYGRSIPGGDLKVEDGTSGAGTLRAASLSVDPASPVSFTFSTLANGSGQYVWHGDSGGPSFLFDTFNRFLFQIAGVHITGTPTRGADVNVAAYRQWIKRTQRTQGDLDGDGKADIAVIGGAGWTTVPVALSTGANKLTPSAWSTNDLAGLATTAGVKALAGDFNGDGRGDLALTGASGWGSIPVGFSLPSSAGANVFFTTNRAVDFLPGWAAQAGVKVVSGDFDGDGRDDIGLVGGPGWSSIPTGLSDGAGGFSAHNSSTLTSFANWAATPNVKALAGDFDGDGRDDIALTGGAGWNSIPIAFSNGNGDFFVSNATVPDFGSWAAVAGVKAVVGDFSGDGRDDIAITGGAGWTTIPVAFSLGTGAFSVSSQTVSSFPAWSRVAGAQLVAGDFNNDLRDDLALTGGSTWSTIPIASSSGAGFFSVVNSAIATFPAQAAQAGAKAVSGHKGN